MQSRNIKLQDTDLNAPLLPYLRRLFNTLNREICLYNLPFNLPCMYSIPLIEQEDFKKRENRNKDNVFDSTRTFNKNNKVELVRSLFVYRHSKEFCYIESCIDSVRISLKFFLKCEFEKKLFDQLTIFMKKNSDYLRIIRKEPVEGFDISFLITYKLLNTNISDEIYKNKYKIRKNAQMGKYDIIQFILKFVVDIDRQIQDKILQSTYFSRYYIRNLLRIVDISTLYKNENTSKYVKQTGNNESTKEVESLDKNDKKCKYKINIKNQNVNTDDSTTGSNVSTQNSNSLSSQLSDSIGRDAVVLKALKARNRIKNLIN